MQKNKLFVGNIPYTLTEDTLQDAFAGYGEIQEVKLITDRDTGRSRGFAFLTFGSDEDAENALEMDGKDLEGRRLVVNVARERPRTRRA